MTITIIRNVPRVLSASSEEPITVAEAGFNLRAIDDGNSPPTYIEEALIARLITAARMVCEEVLEQSLVAKTLQVNADMLGTFELTWGPVREVQSFNYIDVNGVDQVLPADQYRLVQFGARCFIVPAYGIYWPEARYDIDSIRIVYTVGYPSTDSPPQYVPEPIRMAMFLLIGHYYGNREAVVMGGTAGATQELPLGVKALLDRYRTNLGV